MKPTDDTSTSSTRPAQSAGKRSLRGSKPKKTASAKPKAQARSHSTNGSAKSKTKKKSGNILEFASGSGSTVKSVSKLKRNQQGIDRSANALKRIRVSPEQLALAPQITPLLKQAAGGLQQVITALRFSADALALAFLEKYDSIPTGDREYLSIESIALAAQIDITHLLGSIMVSLQQHAVNATRIIAMTNHPKITEARVAYGMLPLGERDRTALDTAMGFLPSPKGPTFIGKAIFGSGKNTMDQQRSDEDDDPGDDGDGPDLDKLFPPANTMQNKLTAIRQRALPPPPNQQ